MLDTSHQTTRVTWTLDSLPWRHRFITWNEFVAYHTITWDDDRQTCGYGYFADMPMMHFLATLWPSLSRASIHLNKLYMHVEHKMHSFVTVLTVEKQPKVNTREKVDWYYGSSWTCAKFRTCGHPSFGTHISSVHHGGFCLFDDFVFANTHTVEVKHVQERRNESWCLHEKEEGLTNSWMGCWVGISSKWPGSKQLTHNTKADTKEKKHMSCINSVNRKEKKKTEV